MHGGNNSLRVSNPPRVLDSVAPYGLDTTWGMKTATVATTVVMTTWGPVVAAILGLVVAGAAQGLAEARMQGPLGTETAGAQGFVGTGAV